MTCTTVNQARDQHRVHQEQCNRQPDPTQAIRSHHLTTRPLTAEDTVSEAFPPLLILLISRISRRTSPSRNCESLDVEFAQRDFRRKPQIAPSIQDFSSIFLFIPLGNYTNEQQSFGPRSYGNMGNDLSQQYQPQASGDDYKRYLNQNIKQII